MITQLDSHFILDSEHVMITQKEYKKGAYERMTYTKVYLSDGLLYIARQVYRESASFYALSWAWEIA